MDDHERLILMKERIIRSFKWRKDIIIPTAEEFGISVEEMEDIFMNALDMSSLESLHSTHDSAIYMCLQKRFGADLNLCWYAGGMDIITEEEARDIETRLANEVYDKKRPYDEVLEEGRQEILQILRNTNVKEE